MRKEPTRSEHLLWSALRDRRLDGYKFRRQHSVGPFILDFYCAEAGLGVEVDGAVHETQQIRDAGRQAALESFGIRFLRLPAALVEHDLEVALQLIQSALTDCPSPAAAGEGSGVRA